MTMTGEPVEIPYGRPVDANNDTFASVSGKFLVDTSNKFIVGTQYTHSSLFPVNPTAPKVQ